MTSLLIVLGQCGRRIIRLINAAPRRAASGPHLTAGKRVAQQLHTQAAPAMAMLLVSTPGNT